MSEADGPDADDAEPAEDETDAAIAETAGAPVADVAASDTGNSEEQPASADGEAVPDSPVSANENGEDSADEEVRPASRRRRRGRKRNDGDGDAESGSGRRRARRYKIQEVIKRNQIILVQVVKEERGNKGAALTTYISLAGRYCVLMPNTARGGGISRKITNPNARKKLKKIIDDLEIRNGMGVIIRTAGTERSKAEIRRDFGYLSRNWDEVRERTFNSIAPALVYEDASLIKRAIRDLYTRDVEEVLVDGVEAYQTAKKYMRMLMPSHAKRVQRYRETDIPPVPPLSDRGAARCDPQRRGAAQIGRLPGHPVDRGAGRHRREFGPFDARAQYRGDRGQHQYRGGRRDRPAAPAARPRRARRHRLHRHAGNPQPAPGRTPAEGGDESGPGAHPDRPDQRFRPAGAIAPETASEPAGGEQPDLSPLPGHRVRAFHRVRWRFRCCALWRTRESGTVWAKSRSRSRARSRSTCSTTSGRC